MNTKQIIKEELRRVISEAQQAYDPIQELENYKQMLVQIQQRLGMMNPQQAQAYIQQQKTNLAVQTLSKAFGVDPAQLMQMLQQQNQQKAQQIQQTVRNAFNPQQAQPQQAQAPQQNAMQQPQQQSAEQFIQAQYQNGNMMQPQY